VFYLGIFSYLWWPDAHGLAGSANPNIIFVIAHCREMASFPIGTTQFLLKIGSAWGSSVHQEILRAPINDAADQTTGR
jgi:hypothetical protein